LYYKSLIVIVAAHTCHVSFPELLVPLLLHVASRVPGWWLKVLVAVEATRDVRDRNRARRRNRRRNCCPDLPPGEPSGW
jgi:hypothetical protein